MKNTIDPNRACSKITIINIIVIIILELLPCGVVMKFANPNGIEKAFYSYFSLIPYGYSNVFPFLTALLSCIMLFTTIIHYIKNSLHILNAVLSCGAVFFSLLPVILGFDCSLISLIITFLLVVETIMTIHLTVCKISIMQF